MACKPSCEAADWGGLDRASSQASWPSGTRKPLTRPTPAPKPTADPDKSWTTVRSPSPACRRFDEGKILRFRGDLVSPARGLCVGSQYRRPDEQQRDRERKCAFAHRFSPGFVRTSSCFSLDSISFGLAARTAGMRPIWKRAQGFTSQGGIGDRPVENSASDSSAERLET